MPDAGMQQRKELAAAQARIAELEREQAESRALVLALRARLRQYEPEHSVLPMRLPDAETVGA